MSHIIQKTILEYQRRTKTPDWEMCNILDMDEEQWDKYKHSYQFALTPYQKIMFVVQSEQPLA